MNRNCKSNIISVVKGNDFSVAAHLYTPDAEGGYSPLSLSDASDVELNLVCPYRRVAGCGVSVKESTVSATFSGSLGVGTYGVEITFRDSKGKARLYERDLVAVVESAADAGRAESAGQAVSVDINARVITLGGASYRQLPDKPSINGVELVGDRTSAELGLVGSTAVSSVEVMTEDEYAALEEKDPATLYVITKGDGGDEG